MKMLFLYLLLAQYFLFFFITILYKVVVKIKRSLAFVLHMTIGSLLSDTEERKKKTFSFYIFTILRRMVLVVVRKHTQPFSLQQQKVFFLFFLLKSDRLRVRLLQEFVRMLWNISLNEQRNRFGFHLFKKKIKKKKRLRLGI